MTKKLRGYWERYCWHVAHYGLEDLFTAYKKPSIYKKEVWADIKDECVKLNGHGLSIIGSSCCVFSCGFVYTQDNKIMFRYYTRNNTYDIELDQECITLGREKKVL
jgi:hypothetical protein